MFDMREHGWKPWRAVFSRAFSTEHVLSLVPDMVEETRMYCETTLRERFGVEHCSSSAIAFKKNVIGDIVALYSYYITIQSSPR